MTNQRETPRPDLPALPWPPILLLAAVAGALLLGHVYPLPWPGANDLPSQIVGRVLGVGGIALLIWAIMTLRRHATTVLPTQKATALVTEGPYRFRRNPIYIADVLILLGVAELTQNIWFAIFAALFIPLVTWLAILPEERHLEREFGENYRAYKASTRRWF